MRIATGARSSIRLISEELLFDAELDSKWQRSLAKLGVELSTERPVRVEGPGNLQSWARDTRYAAAAQSIQAAAMIGTQQAGLARRSGLVRRLDVLVS